MKMLKKLRFFKIFPLGKNKIFFLGMLFLLFLSISAAAQTSKVLYIVKSSLTVKHVLVDNLEDMGFTVDIIGNLEIDGVDFDIEPGFAYWVKANKDFSLEIR